MKIKCLCSQCEGHAEGESIVRTVLLNEDGVYEFTCKKGHHNILVLQNDKYDIAFHEALLELRYCVTKHAVIEFCSALDTFFGFAIKMICSLRGIDQGVYESAWKNVKSQSERQLGAYQFIYLIAFGEAAPYLPDAQRKTRNDCVHKGRIPDFTEAEEFGNEVYKILIDGIQKIKGLENEMISKHGKIDTYIDHELQRKRNLASDKTGKYETKHISTDLEYNRKEYQDYKTIVENPTIEVWDLSTC